MSEVTKVPALPNGERPETGPMQFGDDWPGVFIRGDSALWTAMVLSMALKLLPDDAWNEQAVLGSHIRLLRSCSVKCEVGAAFGVRVVFNKEGADALGKLLKEMAEKLDAACQEQRL